MKSRLIHELDVMEALNINKVEASDVERYLDQLPYVIDYDQSSIEFDGKYIHVLTR